MQYVSENGVIDWRQVQINAAIAAMQAIIGNNEQLKDLEESFANPEEDLLWEWVAIEADSYAEELVKKLRVNPSLK